MKKNNKIHFPPGWSETFAYKECYDGYTYIKKIVRNFALQFVEVISGYWQIGVIRIEKGYLDLKINSTTHHFTPGTYWFFYPPYSIIEYDGYLEECEISIITSNEKIGKLPVEAIGFVSSHKDMPFSLDRAIDIVSAVSNPIKIHRNTHPTDLSCYIKNMIDSNYMNNTSFKELAATLKISQELLSIYFKRNFHLKPVEYRTRLRIINAIELLFKAKENRYKIIDIAYEVGFTDLSHFNRQFKSYTGFSPSFFTKES